MESRASPPGHPKRNGRVSVAPPQRSRQEKPGTGAPLHTKEPVTVASFRTWRGWRENVARNRCLTLHINKSPLKPEATDNPRRRDAACRVSAAATRSIIIVPWLSRNVLPTKNLKIAKPAPTPHGLLICSATRSNQSYRTERTESSRKRKWKHMNRLTKLACPTRRHVQRVCPTRDKSCVGRPGGAHGAPPTWFTSAPPALPESHRAPGKI